jgi:hypothetical protein
MENITLDTKVEFYAGMGYAQGNRSETFTLRELGLDNEDLSEMSEKDFEEFLDTEFEFWLAENLHSGWVLK